MPGVCFAEDLLGGGGGAFGGVGCVGDDGDVREGDLREEGVEDWVGEGEDVEGVGCECCGGGGGVVAVCDFGGRAFGEGVFVEVGVGGGGCGRGRGGVGAG